MWQIHLKNHPIWIIFSHSEYEQTIWGVRGTSYSLSLAVTKTRMLLKASEQRRQQSGCCSVGSFIRTEQHFLNKRRFTKGPKAFSLLLNWLWTEFSLTLQGAAAPHGAVHVMGRPSHRLEVLHCYQVAPLAVKKLIYIQCDRQKVHFSACFLWAPSQKNMWNIPHGDVKHFISTQLGLHWVKNTIRFKHFGYFVGL